LVVGEADTSADRIARSAADVTSCVILSATPSSSLLADAGANGMAATDISGGPRSVVWRTRKYQTVLPTSANATAAAPNHCHPAVRASATGEASGLSERLGGLVLRVRTDEGS
jgi:hypothetical protein